MLKPKGGSLLGTTVLTSLKVSQVNPLFFTKGGERGDANFTVEDGGVA